MAGETSVSYHESVDPDASTGPIATTWLLVLWTLGLAAAVFGAGWTFVLISPRALGALLVFSAAVMYGGPAFLVTWAWLARTHDFRHWPYMVLVLVWLTVWLILGLQDSGERMDQGAIGVLVGLPIVSATAVLRLVAQARSRERPRIESSAPAT